LKKILFRNITSIVLSLVLFLALTISFVFSWFNRQNQSSFIIYSGDYEVGITISLNDVTVNESSPYYDSQKKVLILEGQHQESENFINNLKITFTFSVDNPARFRVKIQDEWQLTRTYYDTSYVIVEAVSHENQALIPGNENFPFIITNVSSYLYDPISGYLYFNTVLEENQTYVIEFITGGRPYPARSTTAYYEDVSVYLDLIVDVVQANRFSQVWGVSPDFFG